MGDGLIIAIVAVGFPLFGLGVFFFWRWQYGVWSIKRRARADNAEVVRIMPRDAGRKEPGFGPSPPEHRGRGGTP